MERESTGFDIRLKQLELTNFRGFSQLSNLVFNERVTVLISENGGGKTSILDAIAAALKVFANQLLKSEFTRLPKLDPKNIKNGTMNGSIELEIEGKISYIEKIEEIVENDILIEASNEIQDSKNFNSKLQINLNEKDTTPRIDGCEATIESEFEFREVLDEYKSYSKKFPMMVKTNGLGAALAFIKSKQKKAYDRIYDDLSVWLQKDHKRIVEFPEKGDLLEIVVKMDSSSGYRALSNEVLAYMNWHRRFTEALIKK